jgi:hypothetical protein
MLYIEGCLGFEDDDVKMLAMMAWGLRNSTLLGPCGISGSQCSKLSVRAVRKLVAMRLEAPSYGEMQFPEMFGLFHHVCIEQGRAVASRECFAYRPTVE